MRGLTDMHIQRHMHTQTYSHPHKPRPHLKSMERLSLYNAVRRQYTNEQRTGESRCEEGEITMKIGSACENGIAFFSKFALLGALDGNRVNVEILVPIHICSSFLVCANIHQSRVNLPMAEQRSFLRVDRDIPELNLPLPEDGPDADAIAASVHVDDAGGDDIDGVDGDGSSDYAAAAADSGDGDDRGDNASGDEEEDEEARLLAAARETIEKHK